MALGITRRDIQSAHHAIRRMRDSAVAHRDAGEHMTGTVVRSLEVGGVAFAAGLVSARFGPTFGNTKIPMPTAVGLGGAVLLHGAAFLGIAGKNAEHLHAAGDGALAFYAAALGAEQGAKMLQKLGTTTATSGMGALPYGGYGYRPQGAFAARRALSPSELYAMANSMPAPLG